MCQCRRFLARPGRACRWRASRASSPPGPSALPAYVYQPAGRLQVPREYLEQLGIGDRVTLEVGDEGILIRPVAGWEAPVAARQSESEEEPPPRRRGLRGWWAKRRT